MTRLLTRLRRSYHASRAEALRKLRDDAYADYAYYDRRLREEQAKAGKQ